MAAPDLPTLYDFEDQIEPAFQGVLATALSTNVTGVFVSRDQEIKDAPRVELEFVKGPAMKQRTVQGSPARQIPNAFIGTLTVRIITTRLLNHDAHGLIRGTVRATLSAAANVITSSNLPYLQILEMTPGTDSPRMVDEKNQDVSVLNYDMWFAIANDAWPTG